MPTHKGNVGRELFIKDESKKKSLIAKFGIAVD